MLKEINPEYSLEGLMLKLKLQFFGHLMEELTHWKRPCCWEILKAGGEGHDRGWDGWMASPTQWTWAWVISGSSWWTGRPGVLWSMGLQRVGHNWATELKEKNFGRKCVTTIVSERWNIVMGVTGTLESMTGNTAFINKSSKGEAEGNVNERDTANLLIFLFFHRYALLIHWDICPAESLMN